MRVMGLFFPPLSLYGLICSRFPQHGMGLCFANLPHSPLVSQLTQLLIIPDSLY